MLCYQRGDVLHGSGYTFTRSDVLDMEINEAQYYLDELNSQRDEEAKALRGK